MICKNCGSELADGTKFCPDCGAKTEWNTNRESVRTLHLKCKNCHGNMEVDASRKEAVCPYCGEKMMILDSDLVAAEKVKTEAYKEVELAKLADEKEVREKGAQKEETEKFRKSKLSGWCIAFTVICLLAAIVCFSQSKILAAIIALVQVSLFTVSWLMGMRIVKEPRKSLHVALAVAGFIMIVLFGVACSYELEDKLDWPSSGLAAMVPKPKSKYGSVWMDYDDRFNADVKKTSKEEFQKYVEECKQKGFVVEPESTGERYEAFDNNGYEIKITWSKYGREMNVHVGAPVPMDTITWPTKGIGAKLPMPKSVLGMINEDSTSRFCVQIGDTDHDAFLQYVEECYNKGFDLEYTKDKNWFRAKDSDGYRLEVTYEGNSVMSISLREPEEEEETELIETEAATTAAPVATAPVTTEAAVAETETAPETTTSEIELVPASLIRPEVKEAIDSYEEFWDEYIDVMKAYASNPSSLEIMTRYFEFLEKSEEMSEKFDKLGDTDLTDAELVYYLEVSNRCTQKMLEAWQ